MKPLGRNSHSAVWFGALVAAGLLGGTGYWLWGEHCQHVCTASHEAAALLREQGRTIDAITRLDAADAQCNCGRFTQGDEPPESAMMRLLLSDLERNEGTKAVDRVLSQARGPLLQKFKR